MTPETEVSGKEITGTRKTVVLVLIGVVAAVSLIGCFVPDAREYVTGIVKAALGSLQFLSMGG
jgi:hypothetical protein